MKSLLILSLFLMSACSLFKSGPDKEAKKNDENPHVRLVAQMIEAVKNNDIELYYSILSEDVKTRIIEREIRSEREFLVSCFGEDLDINQCEISFFGNETRGLIDLTDTNGYTTAFDVVKEDGIWKLD